MSVADMYPHGGADAYMGRANFLPKRKVKRFFYMWIALFFMLCCII